MSTYPVVYEQNPPVERSRLTVFFRFIMVIPQLIWAMLLRHRRVRRGLLRVVRDPLHRPLPGRDVRVRRRLPALLDARQRATRYLVIDEYPPFDGAEHPEYPVGVNIAPPPEKPQPADDVLPRHPVDPGLHHHVRLHSSGSRSSRSRSGSSPSSPARPRRASPRPCASRWRTSPRVDAYCAAAHRRLAPVRGLIAVPGSPRVPARRPILSDVSIVLQEDHGAVRHVVLNRPEKRNALNTELILGARRGAARGRRGRRGALRRRARRGHDVLQRDGHRRPRGDRRGPRVAARVARADPRDLEPLRAHGQADDRADPRRLPRRRGRARAGLRPARRRRRRGHRPRRDARRPDARPRRLLAAAGDRRPRPREGAHHVLEVRRRHRGRADRARQPRRARSTSSTPRPTCSSASC